MARRKTSYDPLFDEPQGRNWGRYALIAVIVVIVGFVLVATLGGSREGQGPVPLIRADETPWTRAPSEAGGMEIPNQDSTVFELMEVEKGEGETAAAAETPATVEEKAAEDEKAEAKEEEAAVKEEVSEEPQDIAKKEEAEKDKEALDKLVEEVTDPADEPAAIKPAVKKEEPVIGAKTQDKTQENSQTEAAKEEPKKIEPKAEDEPAPIKKDMVRVRLGAVPGTSTAEAQSEFARLKGLAGGQLSGFSPSFETVNLPKGSFVRINVPMERMDAARLCDTLSGKGAPCLILSQ